MNQIQNIELNILKEIKRVCEKNGIKFQLIGGSMLGAVRHDGFIPWDDDIDIGMLRRDYEQFLKIANSELHFPYTLNTYKNNPNHHYYFSHVVDSRYSVKRLGSMDKRVENVWVDVYPIDGMPNNLIIRELYYFKMLVIRFFYHLGYFEKVNIARPDRALYQKIIITIVSHVYKLFRIDGDKWREKIDDNLKKYPVEKSKYLFNFIGIKGHKEIFKRDVFLDLSNYKFEDIEVNGTKSFKLYLTQLYDDWEKVPENKKSHPMELLFEDRK